MKIAIVFDRIVRPDTTGIYCEKALKELGHDVSYFTIKEAIEGSIPHEFDLYLQIDDDFYYNWSKDYHPSAYWVIDGYRLDCYSAAHPFFRLPMIKYWRVVKAADFDKVFVAQKDITDPFKKMYFDANWLLAGCDVSVHKKEKVEKKYDWCFVGNMLQGDQERVDLIKILKRKFPNCFVGKAYFGDMAKIYSQSKVIFNNSHRGDVNMRIFEAMAAGGLLLTNKIPALADVFSNIATFDGQDNVISAMTYWLEHDKEREKLAKENYEDVIKNHTYKNRMKKIIEVTCNGKD